ncbi:MAG TPA: type III pantothenate kinase [Pseudonocardiaceae bacterium]|nr:type III pantothenate kinase [Pseudonocardiaceae bacterium]
MLLTVDVGNTNIVLGLFGDTASDAGSADAGDAPLVRDWRMRTEARMTADEMALSIRGLLGNYSEAITGIAALSTVPSLLRELKVMVGRYWSALPRVIVEPGVRTGVPLLYDNPRELGADRIVNTLAAYSLYGGPAIVVDFGTSTNFDVISARGEFLGGALAPGIEISIDALAARAAQLVKVQLVRPRSVIGKSTVEALQSGLLYGFAGQVDGLVRRIAAELAPGAEHTVAVVATGGLASLLITESQTITHHAPHLTLTGLRMVYQRNIP